MTGVEIAFCITMGVVFVGWLAVKLVDINEPEEGDVDYWDMHNHK